MLKIWDSIFGASNFLVKGGELSQLWLFLSFKVGERIQLLYSTTDRDIFGKVQLKDGSECLVSGPGSPHQEQSLWAQLNSYLLHSQLVKVRNA